MKKLLLLVAMALACGGASAAGVKLIDRDTCIKSYIKCESPAVFMHDTQGRCGCLTNKDYMPIRQCIVSFIECAPGTELSHLLDKDGNTVGCGCYATR